MSERRSEERDPKGERIIKEATALEDLCVYLTLTCTSFPHSVYYSKCQAPGQYAGGSAYTPPQDEAHFRDGYVGNNLQPRYNSLIQSLQRPSYAPPPHATGYGGYAPPPGPPLTYGYAPPPGPPPPINPQSYPGQQQAFGGQQQNVIYYFNTPIPPPGGLPTAQAGGYDANGDVGRLREAMRGIGTKEGLRKSIPCFFWYFLPGLAQTFR